MAKKTATQTLTSALKKASKKGITAATLSERTGLPLNTVRFALNTLVKEQGARIVGTESNGVGRPANLYTIFA